MYVHALRLITYTVLEVQYMSQQVHLTTEPVGQEYNPVGSSMPYGQYHCGGALGTSYHPDNGDEFSYTCSVAVRGWFQSFMNVLISLRAV